MGVCIVDCIHGLPETSHLGCPTNTTRTHYRTFSGLRRLKPPLKGKADDGQAGRKKAVPARLAVWCALHSEEHDLFGTGWGGILLLRKRCLCTRTAILGFTRRFPCVRGLRSSV